MKTVICYESNGYESVLRLVKAVEEKFDVTLIDVTKTRSANLIEYDLIGFASEIEDGGFYRDIASFAANWMPREKDIFFIYTSPSDRPEYCEELEVTAHFKNCRVVGKFNCCGADGAGGFRLFGGKGKSHPSSEEIAALIKFISKLTGETPRGEARKDAEEHLREAAEKIKDAKEKLNK